MREYGLPCNAGDGVGVDIDARIGVEDMCGKQARNSGERLRNEKAAFIADAARGRTPNIILCFNDVLGTVGQFVVGDDLHGSTERRIGHWGDPDTINAHAGTAIVAGHGRFYRR